jgi:hypothetical protein
MDCVGFTARRGLQSDPSFASRSCQERRRGPLDLSELFQEDPQNRGLSSTCAAGKDADPIVEQYLERTHLLGDSIDFTISSLPQGTW